MKLVVEFLLFILFYLHWYEAMACCMPDNVDFFCYNRTGSHIYTIYPNDKNLKSKINPLLDSVFIIHGWQSSFLDGEWMLKTMIDFAKYVPNINICAISWGNLASDGYIDAANKHVFNVGSFIVRVFSRWNLQPEKITMVGHSLGAHISGHIGFLLGRRLKAIFGLDPAYPIFCEGDPAPINKRLDSTDAKYVQVITTSKSALGCDDHIGHITFYPDGGTHPQPGCSLTDVPCSHAMGQEYFRLSLNPNIKYVAKKCFDWDTFKNQLKMATVIQHKRQIWVIGQIDVFEGYLKHTICMLQILNLM